MNHANTFAESARCVIEMEGRAVLDLLESIQDKTLEHACQQLLDCQGHIIVIGMGKSGHIGSKIAATLASTGSPAFFVHAAEANHGDLGMISAKDCVLAISHSGETEELISILPILKQRQIPLVLITGNARSTLAQHASITLAMMIKQEACPLGLAPTTSSTAALVLGDALAIALLNARRFTRDDFAQVHPKGQLGRRLLLKVSDIMHQGTAMPLVPSRTPLIQAICEVSQKRLGIVAITDNQQHLLGVFTDGDLRRAIDQGLDLRSTPIDAVMTQNSKTITADQLATEALRIMEENKITALVVVDDQKKLRGIVHIHDILSQGIR